MAQHAPRHRRGRRRRRRREREPELRRGAADVVWVEVVQDELVVREHPPALSAGPAASVPVWDLEASRGRGTPAVPRNRRSFFFLSCPHSRSRVRRACGCCRGQLDEGAAVYNDRDGHACAWDVFEAHAQHKARDSVGRVTLERKSRGKAIRRVGGVGGRLADGILPGQAVRKVEASAVAEWGELECPDEFDPAGFLDEFVEENGVF